MTHLQSETDPDESGHVALVGFSPRIRIISTELPQERAELLGSLDDQATVGALIAAFIGRKDREQLVVLHLDVQHRVIAIEVAATGTLSEAPIHPREVFKAAIANNSAAIVLGHNHPSGSLTPSPNDWAAYEDLRTAGDMLGIPVLDFLIVHRDEWRSLNVRS